MKVTQRKGSLAKIRKENLVPGVMYGRSIDSTSIQAPLKDVLEALKTFGRTQTFKINLDGKEHHVYFKAVQSNILKPEEIIHFDLHRVTTDEKVVGRIPIEVIGHEVFFDQTIYPEQVINDVLAEYSPVQGDARIVVDVSKLELGDVLRLADLDTEGLDIRDDLEQTVIVVKEVRQEVEETEDDEDDFDDFDTETEEVEETE